MENGALVVSPAANHYFWAPNNAALYDNIDLCADVTTVTGVDPLDAKAGLVFWYVDVNNFYVFEIAPNGKASVWRRQRGKWLPQVNWESAEGANPGDGATNQLQVTTDGSQATFSVNGTVFKTLTGSPPDNGQEIGILVVSPAKGAATFTFDNLKVTRPVPPKPAPEPTPEAAPAADAGVPSDTAPAAAAPAAETPAAPETPPAAKETAPAPLDAPAAPATPDAAPAAKPEAAPGNAP